MWWALGQVHLSREQAVDELVIRMTGAAPAPSAGLARVCGGTCGTRTGGTLHPARARRVANPRDIPSVDPLGPPLAVLGASLIAVTLVAGLGAVSERPLERRDSEPTVYEPGNGVRLPSVIREVRPNYTEEAKQAHIEGTVLLDCVVASSGIPRDIIVARSLDAVLGLD
jgi:hypothetical protein